MPPRPGANAHVQREKEISDLIHAVKEHQKFKQLACYSIQALDKAIDPDANKNTWRESVALAIRLDAAAVVCSILQRHPGHENVLLVCVECLGRLAIDKTNALVIAEQNAVPYLLESIKANPDLPEEVLHMAMSLLNNLCSFSKVSAMVLNEDTLRSVLGVIESNNDPLVLNSCINIVEKMSKIQQPSKGGMRNSMDDGQMAKMIQLNKLLNESCVPAMLKALENLSKADIIDDQAEDLVVNITRALSRLAAQSPEVEKRLKIGGGIDSYLAVMDSFKTSERVTKASSKLIGKMMGDNIVELMNTLKTGSLSTQAQERVLSLISSMAMDSNSMDEIMKSDGVSTMISSMETAMSGRALEETARTIARLASSPKHVPQLLESGALSQICKILTSPTSSVSSNLDMQASMSLAINRIAVAAPSALDEIANNPAVIAALVSTLAKNPSHAALTRSTLELFGRFTPEQLSKMDLEPMMTAIISAMECIDIDKDVTTATAALSALGHALAAGGETSVTSLIRAGAIPLALTTLSGGAAREHGTVAVSSLKFLSHVARLGGDEGLKALRDGNAFFVTVDAVGSHMENATVRSAAAEMIQMLSSDELIQEFGNTLTTFADKFEQGHASEEEIGAIPQLALSLGALAMSPENIPKIQAAGGVAPMLTLMGAVANMKDYPNQGELLVTFASCLAEVCGSGVNLDSIDSDVLMKNAVSVLSKHSGDSSACTQTLRLIRTACAAGALEGGTNRFINALVSNGGVDSIATQVRLHPTDDAELLGHAFTIFSELTEDDQRGNERAMDIIQRSGRQIVRCLEENAEMVESTNTHNLEHLMPAMFVLESCAQTSEGRAITSKLGTVKAVMSILSATPNDEEVSAACARTLAAVVTENDVLKVVDRLNGKLGVLRANPADEAVVASLSDDVKKLGLLMMCGDFSGAITQAGGVQHLVDIIALVDNSSSSSSPVHEALTASCITAFGRAAATGTLNVNNAQACIPAIVKMMAEDPTEEVLLAVGALATCDSSILDGLVHNGAVDALVPLLQSGFEGMSDGSGAAPTDAINACFRALSAFCVTTEGCESVVSAGGLAFVVEHLRENMVNSNTGESGLAVAVDLLSNVAQNGGKSGIDVNKELLSAGVLNLVTDALRDLRLINTDAVAVADLSALTNLQSLLATMANGQGQDNADGDSVAKAILAAGVIQQVDALMQQNIFISNNDCALATNSLLSSLAASGCGGELKKLDTDALLMRLMNANATDVEVARACAGTMGAVSGENSGATFTALLRKAESSLDRFTALYSANPISTDLESELNNVNNSLQLLGNLILMDEAVNQLGADEVMALTQRTLAQLSTLGPKDSSNLALNSARDAATASVLTLLGRLANLDYVEVDTDKATEATAAFFVEDDTVSDIVLASAVSCIGGVASSARGVKSIARHGMVARVQRKFQPKTGRVGHMPTENQQLLQSVCATALDAIKATAVSNAAVLVKSEGGAIAISSILTGIASDTTKPKNLSITLDQIMKEVGGLQVLLGALAEMAVTKFQGSGQRKAADAIISTMLIARDSGASYLEVCSPAACIALIEGGGLQDLSPPESAAARRAARKKGGGSNDKQKQLEAAKAKAADVLKLAAPSAASVVLLERLPSSQAGVMIAMHTAGIIDAMSFSINSQNLAVCNAAVGFLSKIAQANTGIGNARLLTAGTPGRCAAALKQLLQSAEGEDGMVNLLGRGRPFLDSSCYLLATIAHTCGVSKMDLEPDAIRVNSSLIEQLSLDNTNAYALAQAKRFGAKLSEAFEDGAEALLEDALKEVAGRALDLLAWQGIEDGKGGIYYFNSKTTETTWDRPDAHATLVGDLTDIVELIDTIGGAEHVDPRNLARALVPLLTTHARDRIVSKLVCGLLSGACRSPEATSLLGVMEQVGDIVVVLDGHSDDLELVLDATDLISVLIEDEVFRDTLSNAVYIGMLLRTAKKYVKNAIVLQRCLSSLGAIASLTAGNTGACLNEGASELVGLSMDTHPDDGEVANSSLLLMEQVLVGLDEFGEEDEEPFGDEDERDERKVQGCGFVMKQLLSAMRKFSIDESKTEVNKDGEDSEFFLLAVRCMGSFSLVDRCIVEMVKKGCSKLTVDGMRAHMNCVDAVISGMELISNLGAIEDDDLDEEMTRYLIEEEAPQIIIEVMNRYDTSVPVLLVTYEALYNIGNDEAAAEIFVDMGVIRLAFTTIQNFDYEKMLVAQVMKFLSVMSYDERAVEEIAVLGWLPIVFQAIQTRLDNEEFVLDAVMVICNSVNDERSQEIVVEDRDLLHQLLDLLNTYDESVDVVQQVIITCSRLATNEEVSLLMASEGMPFFMRATADLGMSDTELLGHLFGLLYYLAFQKENIKVIVQHGGIRVLCAVMEVEEYQNDTALMLKALGMMDNVVSADEEFADIVADKGGRTLVEQLKALHMDNGDMKSATTSCLLTMEAMAKQKQEEGSKTGRAALFARLGGEAVSLEKSRSIRTDSAAVEPQEDPLILYRGQLVKGVTVKVWNKGISTEQRLTVPDSFNAIILKDIKSKSGVRLPLRSMDAVTAGFGEGHMKKSSFGSSTCKDGAEVCLKVNEKSRLGESKEVMALSFKDKVEFDEWFPAISRLVETNKNWSHRLKDPNSS